MKRTMYAVGTVLWLIPVTITLLIFAGLAAIYEAVKGSPLWPNNDEEDDDL